MTQEWPNSNPTEEGNVDRKEELEEYQEYPKFDELPGEDKDDWQYKDIICIALGLEDFFEPKQNFKEGNSSVAKVFDFRSDDKEDQDTPTKPEFQMPKDLVASTKLYGLKLQPTPCSISKSQGVNFSKLSHKGTLEANRAVIVGAQNPSDIGSVGRFTRLELFCVNHLDQCSLKTKLMLDTNSERKTDLVECGDGFTNSVEALKEEGTRETYIEKPIYDEDPKPIYDEDPRESQECWLEQDFILGALGEKGNDNTKCGTTTSHLEDRLNSGLCLYWPEFEDHQNVCKEACLSIMSKKDPTEYLEINQNKDVLCRDSPSAANYSGLGEKSNHLDKKNMFIFDPGGLVHADHSTGVSVIKLFKEMISYKVTQDAVIVTISTGDLLGQLQETIISKIVAIVQLLKEHHTELRKNVFVVLMMNSTGVQGQEILEVTDGTYPVISEINQHADSVKTGMIILPYKYQHMVLEQGRPGRKKSMSPEYHQASKKSVTIYVFDPGGRKLSSEDLTMRTWFVFREGDVRNLTK